MSRFKRILGRVFLGGDVLAQANWDDAVYHHERAVAIEPDAIAFCVGLAETLVRRDRLPEAIEQFRMATSLPYVHPGDPDYQARARSRLDRLVAVGRD